MTAEVVRAVYDVLVSECGAAEDGRDDFAHHWPECKEYRFGGSLGFGGKVWSNRGQVYVTCYPEDATPRRLDTIERANTRLAALPWNQ